MTDSNKASEITRYYKFKEYIEGFADDYKLANKVKPTYVIDYTLDSEKLGLISKTDLGSKFISFIIDRSSNVTTLNK